MTPAASPAPRERAASTSPAPGTQPSPRTAPMSSPATPTGTGRSRPARRRVSGSRSSSAGATPPRRPSPSTGTPALTRPGRLRQREGRAARGASRRRCPAPRPGSAPGRGAGSPGQWTRAVPRTPTRRRGRRRRTGDGILRTVARVARQCGSVEQPAVPRGAGTWHGEDTGAEQSRSRTVLDARVRKAKASDTTAGGRPARLGRRPWCSRHIQTGRPRDSGSVPAIRARRLARTQRLRQIPVHGGSGAG